METIQCPCCGESYDIDAVIADGQKFFCGKCSKKIICFQDRLIPFSPEIPQPMAMVRQTACPYCDAIFEWENDVQGEYSCPECGRSFYLGPRKIYADNKTEKPEAATVEKKDHEVMSLLRFSDDSAVDPGAVALNRKVKVGKRRKKSGIGGIFISIAEKLCGN